MPRFHAFELLDFPRFPGKIRDYCTDYLQFIIRTGNAYSPVVKPLARALRDTQVQHIVDLCSGAGGPWPALRAALGREGASRSAVDANVVGNPTPVSAEDIPQRLAGFRTMFSSFHHFAPRNAQAILRDAAINNDGIAIVEITSRKALSIAMVLISPLFVWLATPQLKPFSGARLFWTYIIPVVPLVVCFDGIISSVRTYNPNELRELVLAIGHAGFDWEIGEARGRGPMTVTYAIGVPRATRDASGAALRDL